MHRRRPSQRYCHRILRLLFVGFAVSINLAVQAAVTDCPPRPQYRNLRFDENWSVLRNPVCMKDPWDRLKYITFGSDNYVSLGGEARLRYEWFNNPGFGSAVEDKTGYLLQRYLIHADTHLGNRFRVFGQFQSALVSGRYGGPRAFDEDRLDIHQLFGDWRWRVKDSGAHTFRIGRQELEFGASRVISARDGLNTRQSFDGLRWFGGAQRWNYDVSYLRVVRTGFATFDNASNANDTFYGGSINVNHDLILKSNSAIYLNHRNTDVLTVNSVTGPDRRYMLGSRNSGASDRADYNWEFGTQFGEFAGGTIRAWYVATDTGLTMRQWPLAPRFGLRFDATSGDRQRGDQTFNTFVPPFASTAYSGLSGLVGPSNVIDFAPSVTLRWTDRLATTFGTVLYWRVSTEDGIYNFAGVPIRPASSTQARYVGQQATITATYNYDVHLSLLATLYYFRVGQFIKDNPPAEDVTYFTTWVNYRF